MCSSHAICPIEAAKQPQIMRAVLLLVGLIACSSLARAWEVCEPRNYDCKCD